MNEVIEQPRAAPMTAIQRAIEAGATPEQLERILDLTVRADEHALNLMREKRKMDEEDRKLAALMAFRRDFAAFRGENIVVPKSKFVDRGKAGSFHQAEFGATMDLLSPALSKHGFGIRHDVVFGSKRWVTDGVESDIPWVYVTCYLEHRDTHSERLDLEGPPGEATANTPVQNMQVTGSYLKRQSTLAITGTATADEDNESRLRPRNTERDGADDPLEPVIQAGRDAAMSGMEPLLAWWGKLTSKQRTELGATARELRRVAEQADGVKS